MIQNKIDKVYTEQELQAIDSALAVLEQHFGALPILSTVEKQRLVKLPDGAEEFVANMKAKATTHADLLPRKYDDTAFDRDNALSEQLAPRRGRIEQLTKRLESLQLLVDSDRFSTALFLRRTLKANGKSEGLDEGLDEGLRRFLSRTGDDETPAPPPAK